MKGKHSQLSKLFLGLAVLFTGIGILLDIIGFIHFHPGMLLPFLILYGAARLFRRGRKIVGTILFLLGSIMFLEIWFHIDAGEVMGLAISLAIIYWGYRIVRGKDKGDQPPFSSPPKPPSTPHQEQGEDQPTEEQPSFTQQKHQHSLIGKLFLTGARWELQDLTIWHGIGEVKIDLSRAHIHEGETIIMISGWIGDIDIYAPYDLDLAFHANVNMGDIDVFGNKQGGLGRSVSMTTENYQNSTKKVRIIVSLLVGDIDITHV